MKMKLFYVAELDKSKSKDVTEDKRIRFEAGPFGSWDQADDAKQKAKDKRLGHPEFCIVSQIVDVEFDS